MDQATIDSLLKACIYGVIATLAGLVAWFARLWVVSRSEKDDALQQSLSALAAAVSELSKALSASNQTQARHDERIKEHDEQLRGIWDGKNCLNEGCPLRPK